MSDVFSFITARAIGSYYESLSELEKPTLPIISPLSLRKNSLALDEGNNRAIKRFPIVFPIEPIEKTYDRFSLVSTSSGSYDQAGRAMKFLRRTSIFEMPIRRISAADFISETIGRTIVLRKLLLKIYPRQHWMLRGHTCGHFQFQTVIEWHLFQN